MEQIDDDCAKRGIHFVKVSEDGAAENFGVARLPSLVFFKKDLPSLYEGTKSSRFLPKNLLLVSIFMRGRGLERGTNCRRERIEANPS